MAGKQPSMGYAPKIVLSRHVTLYGTRVAFIDTPGLYDVDPNGKSSRFISKMIEDINKTLVLYSLMMKGRRDY
jgi:hypothetical protein